MKNQLIRPPDEYLQRLVCDTVMQRLPLQASLKYINRNLKREDKKDISRTKLIRIRRYMKDHKFDRLFEIAKDGFVSQHLDRIDDLLLIKKEMWACYFAQSKTDPFKAAQILTLLMQVQPYISQYYEASKHIMEKVRRVQGLANNVPGSEFDYIPSSRALT